jgi:molybdopterin/thiamine biosynthesis adenylyltransferase
VDPVRPRIVLTQTDRYTALQRIEGWRQDRVRRATVLVAGAGALGNEILKNLALLGVGHIIVVDLDRVELPNLARAILFRQSDDGQPKAETAARAVQALNPDITVVPIQGDVAFDVGLGIFRRVDVVFGGLDNRRARVALNEQCWRTGRPWVDGALTAAAGLMRVFVPPEGACYECSLSDADYAEMNLHFSCQGVALAGFFEGKIPTTPTIASIIGAMQVQEALKLLHDQPVLAGHEIIYDSIRHSLETILLPRRGDCLGHSVLGPVTEVAAFRAEETTAAQLLDRARADLGPQAHIELDRDVAVDARCRRGHAGSWEIRPVHRLKESDVACPVCGAQRELVQVHAINDSTPCLDTTLAAWGLPPAHIVRARHGRQTRYYELTGDVAHTLPWAESKS